MNKKVLLITILIVVVGIVIAVYNNNDKHKIPTYKSDIVCSKSSVETLDDEEYVSKSNVYIYKNKDDVRKIIVQSIMSSNSDIGFLESIINLYATVDGLDARLNTIGDSYLFEVTYDYDKIDLDLISEKLGSIIDEDSLLMGSEELPIKVDDYLEYLGSDYKCEVK